MTRVKICGIRSLEAGLAAAEAGVEAIGFVFWPKSRRYIAPSEAAAIAAALPPFVARVGVFVDEAPSTIRAIAAEVGLTALQFHGRESPQACRSFLLPVIKTLSVRDEDSLLGLGGYPVQAYLLDTFVPEQPGGTGRRFDWHVARRAVEAGHRIILAGGLDPDNVAEAIQAVQPYGVDVSSGVETGGRKDLAKIHRFVAAVRAAETIHA